MKKDRSSLLPCKLDLYDFLIYLQSTTTADHVLTPFIKHFK